MDLSPSSLRRDDPAIMLFGKRIQGPFTNGAAEIKERLSPCGVDEQGVSFGTSSDEEENHSSSNPSVGTGAGKEVGPGGKAKAMGSQAGEKAEAAEMLARCPRCHSADTKFCYFNNYNVNQPRHFCKHCQRYWTAGGTLRNVPVGAGKRKSKHSAVRQASFPPPVNTNLDLFAAGAQPNLHSGFPKEIKAPLPNLQFEPTELCIVNRNPQSGFLGLDAINADPQSGLGKINPNLPSEFSVLREINTNLQSGFFKLGEIKANPQSGCSGLGIIKANLEREFPGSGGIKANLQTGFHGLAEIGANLQSGFSGSGANLQSRFSRLGANLHTGRPQVNASKLNSQSERNESSQMKDQVQASSENKPSGACSVSSDSNAHLTGEYNGFSRIKAPHACSYRDEPHKTPHSCFHGDEPLCSSEFTPVNSTEGAFNKNSLEKVRCHEAGEAWCSSGEVVPVVGGQWPCFYNMYWVDGMPQEALTGWPHFTPVLTPQGWGMSCVGGMTPSIFAAAAAAPTATMNVPSVVATTTATTAAVVATTTPPIAMLATLATTVAPTTSAPPPNPIAMLATHLNPPNTTSSPPPISMLATHLHLTDDDATTILGKRNAQHESMEEHDGFFCNYRAQKCVTLLSLQQVVPPPT